MCLLELLGNMSDEFNHPDDYISVFTIVSID